MTRLRHYDHDGRVRFITFSCHRRLPVLSDDLLRRFVTDAINTTRKEFGFKLLAYVIMPEHVHLIILPMPDSQVGYIVGQIKIESAKNILRELKTRDSTMLLQLQATRDRELKRVLWLKRCFDHNCRDRDMIQEKIDYCHFNPVNRGLVSEPSDWKYSSSNWYEGTRDVPLEIDEIASPEGKPTLRVGHL